MITDINAYLGNNYTAIKNELIEKGIAESVTTATASVTTGGNHRDVEEWQGKRPGESVNMGWIRVSDDYFKTLGMTMKEGRNFDSPSDTLNVIFNALNIYLMRPIPLRSFAQINSICLLLLLANSDTDIGVN